MKVASLASAPRSGGKHNKAILTLFGVVILLFGLLAGLYVVNERLTLQNRASEPQDNQLVPSVEDEGEEPYIECRWNAEEGVQYAYRITETDVASGDETILPEGTISLGDGASIGTDGIETSSSDGMASVVYRNVQDDMIYTCEIFVDGPKCGEATYTFSSSTTSISTSTTGDGDETLTATATPTGTLTEVVPGGSGDSSTSQEEVSSGSGDGSGTLGDADASLQSDGTSPTSASSGSNNGSGSESGSGLSGTSPTSSVSPSATPTSSISSSQSQSGASASATLSPTSTSTSKGGVSGNPTSTPPVAGLAGASILLLLGGLFVIVLGFLL